MEAGAGGARETAEARENEIDRRLGTETHALRALAQALRDSYTAECWGLPQFAAIEDPEQRALASDLLVSVIEGIEVNLREMALCEIDLAELIGPNGRTMPGPETTVEDLIDLKRSHQAVTDFARAFGSVFDCLAAAAIGILCLPSSIHSASGSQLFSLPEISRRAPERQQHARIAVARVFREHADYEPVGWLAWTLELRNAVVHRGHLTGTWLPRPRLAGQQFAVRTDIDVAYLIRMEPHLRGRPWQPDIFALSQGSPEEALIWLPEPATVTLAELKRRTVTLVEAISALLCEFLTGERDGWLVPEHQWRMERTAGTPRSAEASRFSGFEPDYPTPPPDQIRVHPHSAARLVLAERLRQALRGRGEDGDV
jgi:hypothetical protein